MKTLLVLLIILPALNLKCQVTPSDESKIRLGITFSYFTETTILIIYSSESQTRLNGKEFYSLGMLGIYSINKNLGIECGLIYAKFRINVDSWDPDPGYMEDVPIVNVPLTLRTTFSKYFFITSGLFFEFDINHPGELRNQSGIGLTAGSGFNYNFRNGLSIFANPYLNVHSLISYTYGPGNIKILETSIRIGLLYRL